MMAFSIVMSIFSSLLALCALLLRNDLQMAVWTAGSALWLIVAELEDISKRLKP